MNPIHRMLPSRALVALLGGALLSQAPLNPPPWWGVVDNVTVSLYWDFAGGSLAPTSVVAPPWYNPAITHVQLTGPVAPIGSLNGHTGVLGFTGTGAPLSGTVEMTVDNDPHLNWVKIFYFQADVFEGATGSIVEAIKQDLGKYDRSSVAYTTTPIGQGWVTVTVQAQLIPQPDDEEIDWTLTENALGTVAIDNVFVSSKCVKIGESDQDGAALGDVAVGPVDLNALTSAVPGGDCIAAVVTEGAAPTFARTLWVAKRGIGAGVLPTLIRTQAAVLGTTPLPSSVAVAPQGPVDLAVETIVPAIGTHVQYVYALFDERVSPGGNVRLLAYDTTGTSVPQRDVTITNFPGTQATGVAFQPSGLGGIGTFLVADDSGHIFEFDRGGAPVAQVQGLPAQGRGLGYDPVFGRYYLWSDQPVPTPRGALQVNGAEISAYDGQPTGVRFWGDLSLPNAGGPPGGVAAGLEAFRLRSTGKLRLGCVAITSQSSFYYELAAPFRYGASLDGVTGMAGLPFAGAANFAITLSGARRAQFATLYAGFSNSVDLGTLTPLPFALTPLGFFENNVLASLDLHSAILGPSPTGDFVFAMPTLPAAFRGSSMFFQWLVFDPSARFGLAMSQAGKTVIY